ncbi:primosomal protein N' [Xylanimonas ulmi]|uniref:Probable replication restart protein PriA n=1 Tax=Xylanimonas ulmi TaxID=228973 RepID=A0A4Q7M339_9MICO|nr:primosomal protein N' [Xylanibacterium ulmi]RZS60908.1 replication restart DNA helicase PriA [Xylanibacterium ulmi]
MSSSDVVAPGADAADGQAQDALLALAEVAPRPARRRRATPLGAQEMAADLPVARVVLDLQPAHLDREYDYLVPAAMADGVRPGARVRVRFGAQEVDGFVVARLAESDHDGRLAPLRRLVSPEPVLTPATLRLARAVAERWAGTTADVLRLAVPPRHARTESQEAPTPDDVLGAAPAAWAGLWSDYRGGEAFLAHVSGGGAPKAVWTPLPGLAAPVAPGATPTLPHWAAAVAMAVRAAAAAGRGSLVVVPDARDAARVGAALETAGAPGVVRLLAEDGAAPRYRAFLAAARGHARVVVGTRAAMFAPVADLGLIAVWGDGEDTLAEPHAPYPHARDVLALRSDLEGAAFLLGSPGRTAQAQALLDGWAHEVVAPRDVVRARAARVRALTSVELASEGPGAGARIPTAAWRAAHDALAHGPVLVQVPRTGYLPVVACAACRTPAACEACHGPLGLGDAGAAPQCRWCGRLAGAWRCGECGATGLRAVRVGTERTAEELGRAFPGVPVRVSASTAPGGVLDRVPARPAVVVATPGAEPVADGGYTAALLLDAAVATATLGLATGTRALHRWLAAAHLVRPASAGGQVLLVGDAAPGPTGAFVRFDPGGFAARELAERVELALPPAVRVASVTGDRAAVGAVVGRVDLATPATTLGPVETEPDGVGDGSLFDAVPVRVVVRVPPRDGLELAQQLRASLAVRSARREPGTVRVRLDPEEMV